MPKKPNRQKPPSSPARIIIPIILVVAVLAISIFVFNKVKDGKKSGSAVLPADQSSGPLSQWRTQCSGSGPVMMQHPPMDIKDVSLIHPVGLLAAAHVTPIDHLYLYSKGTTARDANPVYAMADGYIVDDDMAERGQTLRDGKVATGAIRIVVQYNCTFYSYYDLMTSLDPGLAAKLQAGEKHVPIKAGQVIGRVGAQSLDVAIYNLEAKLPGFVHPETYSGEFWKIYTDDFFKYFTGKDRSDMLALNPRKIEPYGGKIDYDIPGKLRGNWFEVGTNSYAGPKDSERTALGDSGYFSGHLTIAPDAVTPSTINLSFGSFAGKPQQFNARSQSPDPASVGESSGVITYELVDYKQPTLLPSAQNPAIRGTVLLQVIDGGNHLKMEAFPGKTAAQVATFTAAAKTYER